jgi:hypothetical protein
MIRIRGTVGQWPVDLTVEMDAEDWAQLAAQVQVLPDTASPTARPKAPDDALWQATLSLVQQAGRIEGPELLGQVEGLAGSTAAGKRLLVRLRHCAQVRVESGADAPVYCWTGQAG